MDRILLDTKLLALWALEQKEGKGTCSELVINCGPNFPTLQVQPNLCMWRSESLLCHRSCVLCECQADFTLESLSLGVLSSLAVLYPQYQGLHYLNIWDDYHTFLNLPNRSFNYSIILFRYFMDPVSVVTSKDESLFLSSSKGFSWINVTLI